MDKADFIKILKHGLPHVPGLVASANRDTAKGTHMRGISKAMARVAAEGTSTCRAGVRAPLRATHELRQHIWRNLWGLWSTSSPEGSEIRERVRAFGVSPSDIDGRIVQVLERKFKAYLSEALKVQDQIILAGLADATRLQTMEAAAQEVPVMGLHLQITLDIAKLFNCVDQSDLTSTLLRSNCSPNAKLLPGIDAAEVAEGIGAASWRTQSPRSEPGDDEVSTHHLAPASSGGASGVDPDPCLTQPGRAKRTRDGDGLVSPPPKRQLKQVFAQLDYFERVKNPEVEDWVKAAQSGDLTMLTKLLVLVQDAADTPVCVAAGVLALPTVRQLSLWSGKGQFAEEMQGITCFPPRVVTSLRLGHRFSIEQANKFSELLHMDLSAIARANAEFARILKAAVHITRTSAVARVGARCVGAAVGRSACGAARAAGASESFDSDG